MKRTDKELLRLAVIEGVRWWIAFDGPLHRLIKTDGPKISLLSVRSIAMTYNFQRNLPSADAGVQLIADEADKFRGKHFPSLNARAEEIQTSAERLFRTLKSHGTKSVRPISGMTKLTLFVSPEKWTPFDRLAAKAVGAKKADTMARMRQYYCILDDRGFLETSVAVKHHLENTAFSTMGGERFLDKYLMLKGEEAWTDDTVRMSEAWLAALPSDWRKQIEYLATAISNDGKCHFDTGLTT